MKSKVHPTYKTKYRVANWPAYNRALVRRGDVTVWLSSEAIVAWTPRRSGRRGGQRRYSDLAIETALTLRLLYHLPLRQAEGFLHALFGMMRLDLSAPDYTTLSRRSRHLRRRLRPVPPDEGIHLVLDSTGLSIVWEGEWAAAKHGGRGRRGWRKLHLGVDQSCVIRVHTLTEATGDDATTALDLLTAVEGPLVRVTADAAYDTVAVYETARARGATVVIPPAKTATVSGHGPRSPARDRTITLVKTLGRRQWQKASGYHRQGRVENAFFRYKSIIGDSLRARRPAGQGSEAVLGCEILNRVTALGRPVSYRIALTAGEDPVGGPRAGQSRFVQQRPEATLSNLGQQPSWPRRFAKLATVALLHHTPLLPEKVASTRKISRLESVSGNRPIRTFMCVKESPSLFGGCIDWVDDARSVAYPWQYISAGEIVFQVVVLGTQNERVACQCQLEDMSVVAVDRGIAQSLCRARKLGVANQYSLLPTPIFLEHAPHSVTVRQFVVILAAVGIRYDAVSLAYPRA